MHMLILINQIVDDHYHVVCHKYDHTKFQDQGDEIEEVETFGYITTAVVAALRKQGFKIECPEEKFCLEKFAEDNNLDYDFVCNKRLETICYLLKDY